MSKVYISGKVTGLSNYKAIFEEAEKKLRALGLMPVNPRILSFFWIVILFTGFLTGKKAKARRLKTSLRKL